ncbi:MAG TPA: choice-of-anchor Q domain-containing protein [Thermoanaerobaculia bacterium]|jgi:CSLREA domain-containing protein|nr:choice-of-anchor Q domain-containing protein [Thermoanaerobaculia bacterium]
MKCSLRRTLEAAFALLALVAFTPAASAAVYIPSKTVDTADGNCNADCSLREAVLAANAHAGDDVILLHAGIYGLSLPGGLDVSDDLVVLGDGAGRTIIDGGGVDRIFDIPAGVTAEISDVTLRNGHASGAGGAIQNAGQLTVARSALTGNSSSGLGGAISTDGGSSALTVTDSLVAGNTAQGRAGAIAVHGDTTLANVTVTGNQTSADFGGGLYIFSFTDAQVTLNNVTIAGNTAASKGGGAFIESSAFIGLSPKVTNSILAGNTAASEPDCSGPVESGYDLIGSGAGCVGPSAANHDIVGALSPIDPKLGPLAQNGGPTSTRALLAGSPALDAGNPATPGSGNGACEATDQRGATRPGGARCDIGAFEETTACVAGGSVLCLNNGRFKVTATRTANGTTAPAQSVTLTGESGYFWFFDPGNVEITIKVLNACALNNRYWVFAAGMTNVNVVLTVTDTKTGATKTYTNPQNRVFRSILDTGAFATCP